MKVAVTQPNFIPWLGYFELLDYVDLWICYDNVVFPKGSYINRNKIKINNGHWKWITVPLQHFKLNTPINKLSLSNTDWPAQISRRISNNYRQAEYFPALIGEIQSLLVPRSDENNLARYNLRIIKNLCEWMSLKCDVITASEYFGEIKGTANAKMLFMLKEIGASKYYNFANGINANLYRIEDFKKNNIELYKQDYNHPSYPQTGEKGSSFMSHLSIIDLLFNDASPLERIREGRRWITIKSELG